MMSEYLRNKLIDKFFRYVAIPSQSDESQSTVPTSPGQWELARLLARELAELDLVDIALSEHGVLTAHLPARLHEGHRPVKTVGWCAHLDTVDVKLSPIIHPQIIRNYDGNDLVQNAEKGIVVSTKQHPELLDFVGDDIIISDGTSVLGADDKSAIANIMTALEVLKENPQLEHGTIYVAFVPDEEIGLLGSKSMDYDRFPVDFAYTIDCDGLGNVVTQTFNAGSAVLKIRGQSAHPMNSKNNVVNPVLIATDFINLLDRAETPENTEGTEGFIWAHGLQADVLNGTVSFVIRDHDRRKYEAKKAYLQKALEITRQRHPKAVLSLTMQDTYGNIADALNETNRECVDYLYQGLDNLQIAYRTIAMRGGTDGSFISTKGIPTPNYFTGAFNFHASCEFLPVSAFEKSCQLTLELIRLIAQEK